MHVCVCVVHVCMFEGLSELPGSGGQSGVPQLLCISFLESCSLVPLKINKSVVQKTREKE